MRYLALFLAAAACAAEHKIPVYFEPDPGQVGSDSRVPRFLMRGRGLDTLIEPAQMVFQVGRATLRATFVGADPGAAMRGLNPLGGASHYLLGRDRSRWLTGVPHFAKVQVTGMYPKIGVVYYENQGSLEQDFLVEPGGDPARIRIAFTGADRLEEQDGGELVLHAAEGAVRLRKPSIYQAEGGVRREIAGSYLRTGEYEVGFQLGDYDAALPLVIDPVITATRALRGSAVDFPAGVATDAAGNVYVTGQTASADFPTVNPFSSFRGGGTDIFIVKLDPQLQKIIYATFLGGTGFEEAGGIAVDRDGSVVVTGRTESANFPLQNSLQPSLRGLRDMFVTKLSADGSRLQYSSYWGGISDDGGRGIRIDREGNAYVMGSTTSADFPTTSGASQRTAGGGGDAFVMKWSANGSQVHYSTLYGGSGGDLPTSLAVNPAGEAFLLGSTTSQNLPNTADGSQPGSGGSQDGFLMRLDREGRRVLYATYWGGSGQDGAQALALDPRGGAWIGGFTNSTANFPFSSDAPHRTMTGNSLRGFVARILAEPRQPAAGAAALRMASSYEGSGIGGRPILSLEFSSLLPPGLGPLTAMVLKTDSGMFLLEMVAHAERNGSLCGMSPSILQFFLALEQKFSTHVCSSAEISYLADNPENQKETAGVGIEILNANNVDVVVSKIQEDDLPRIERQAQNRNSSDSDDPVSLGNGEFYSSGVFFRLGGALALELTHHYSSLLSSGGARSALGANRMHNFEASLALAGSSATVTVFPGRAFRFERGADGRWRLAERAQRAHQLAEVGGGFQFLELETNRIFRFGPTGQLTRVEDRNGNALTVTQGTAGPTMVSDGQGRTLEFFYDGGRLVRVRDHGGREFRMTYAGANLASITDPEEKTTTFQYGTAGGLSGLLTEEKRPAGNVIVRQSYDASGRASEQSDGLGQKTRFAYDTPSAGVTTMTDARGHQSRHTHRDRAHATEIVDPAGEKIELGYDANNRRTRIKDRMGDETRYGYDDAGNLISATDPLGNQTSLAWEPQIQGPFTFFNLKRVQYADGSAISYTHDERGNVVSTTDQAGKVTQYSYNAAGQPLTVRNALGGVTAYAYNADQTLASVRTPTGEQTRYSYDSLKRPVQVVDPDGTSSTMSYDRMDRPVKVTDGRNKATEISWDDNGNLRSLRDRLGNTRRFDYDANDRLVSLTRPSGKISRVAYDETGNVSSFRNGAGDTLRFVRDSRGRITAGADCTDRGPRYTYDGEGLRRSSVDALGRGRRVERDRNGRLTRLTTTLDRKFEFSFDRLGRLTRQTDPLGAQSALSYDPRGLVSGISIPGGIAAAYSYDDLGQLARVADPNGGLWQRSYDASGRLSARRDPLDRTTAFSYGPDGLLGPVAYPDGGSLVLSRDATGNLLRRLFSDGTDIRYSYDDDARLVSADELTLGYDADGRLVESNGLRISRDDAGRIASVTYAEGKTVTYKYDCRGLVTEVSDWMGGVTALSYDAAGRLTSMRRPNGQVTEWSHDGDGRMSSVRHGDLGSILLARDAAGNVTSADRNLPLTPAPAPGTSEFSYDAAHQVAEAAHDARGRRQSDSARSYVWDAATRLTEVASESGASAYGYDALDLRTRVSRGELTRTRVWNYGLPLPSVAVVRQDGADARYYVHLPNGMLLHLIEADGARRFYHYDETGSTVFLTNDAAEVTDTYDATPYGEFVARAGETENPFVWLGAFGVESDGDGLYYMRHRYYDARSARFLSRDPLVTVGPRRINPYQYARANPMRFRDPTGLMDEDQTSGLKPMRDPGAVPEETGKFIPAQTSLWWLSDINRNEDPDDEDDDRNGDVELIDIPAELAKLRRRQETISITRDGLPNLRTASTRLPDIPVPKGKEKANQAAPELDLPVEAKARQLAMRFQQPPESFFLRSYRRFQLNTPSDDEFEDLFPDSFFLQSFRRFQLNGPSLE